MNRLHPFNIQALLALTLAGSMLFSSCQAFKSLPESPFQEEAGSQPSNPGKSLSAAPIFSVNTSTQEDTTDDNRTILFTGLLEMPSVAEDGFEALAKTLDEEAASDLADFQEAILQYASQAKEDQSTAEDFFFPYFLKIRLENTRTDSRILSLKRLEQLYLGKDRNLYEYTGSTYDAQTGKPLTLPDLVTDWDSFREKAIESCIAQTKDLAGSELVPGYEDIIRGSWDREPTWYLDAAGVTVIYNPLEISSSAVGTISCHLTYEEYADLIKPEYAGFTGSGTAALPADTDVYQLLSKDADTPERLCLSLRPADKDGYAKDFYVEVDDRSEKAETFERLGSAYLLRRPDGRLFLLFDGDYMSDDYSALTYELTGGAIQKRSQSPVGTAIAPGTVNVDSLSFRTTFNALGTYSIPVPYHLTEDGVPATDMTRFSIPASELRPYMTVQRTLPVTLAGEEATLPAGTLLRVTALNLTDTVWFETDNHLRGEIHYTREENPDYGPLYIDGVWENEYFDMIPYAG